MNKDEKEMFETERDGFGEFGDDLERLDEEMERRQIERLLAGNRAICQISPSRPSRTKLMEQLENENLALKNVCLLFLF